jgi:hypothetical protein
VSNTLTSLIPSIYAGLNVVAREMIGIIPAVTRNSGIERAAVGQSIVIPAAPAVTASAITPGVTPPNDGDQVFANTAITIDSAYRVPIRWNGEEMRGINSGPGMNTLIVQQWAQAFRTLANQIEANVVAKAVASASRATGTAGTTPFGSPSNLQDLSNAAQILDDNGAPMSDRQLVLGSKAINNLRGVQSLLFKVNEAGTDALLRDGVLGRLEGFDVHNSYGVKSVTKGTGANYVLASGTYPVGTTSLALVTGTGTINPGDAITLAGDTNVYMVVGTGIAAPGTITIGGPGLLQAHAAADALTVGNSYAPNLAFSRSAIVLATRAPALPIDMNGNARDMAVDRTTVTDPVSGIVFEISEYAQYRQIQYEVALAWGAAVVNQPFIAVLRG